MKAGNRARGASALALVGLFVAAGCGDETGGDGFVPDNPASAGKAGGGGEGGMEPTPSSGTVGMGGEGGEPSLPTSGKGSGGHGGTAGKSSGGAAGTAMTEGGMAGMGGETGPKSVCGNSIVEPGEDCDDGNTKSFDGCPADCHASCEVCEKTFCAAVRSDTAGEFNWQAQVKKNPYDPFTNCSTLAGTALHGPAQNVPRAELCEALVDCVRRERCAQLVPDRPPPPANEGAATYDFMHCFCSLDVTSPDYVNTCKLPESFDPNAKPNYIGKCKREFQEAAEADTEDQVLGAITSNSKAFASGNTLLESCDRVLCTEECLPEASVGVVAQITTDILAAKNGPGESAIGDLLADAERAATGTDFAFVNDGSYGSDYGAPGFIFHGAPGRAADADGRVLESEVRQLLFGMVGSTGVNDQAGRLLLTMQLTGQQIYAFLTSRVEASQPAPRLFTQVSGLTYTWDATAHVVTEVRKDGGLIDKAASYSVTVNDSFSKYVVGAASVVTTDKNPEQELVKYLKAQPQPVAPPTLNRISLAQ